MALSSFKKIQEYLRIFLQMHSRLYKLSKRELEQLTQDILLAFRKVEQWQGTVDRGKMRIKPENKQMIKQIYKDISNFSMDFSVRLKELEELDVLHKQWESALLPKKPVKKVPYIDDMVNNYQHRNINTLSDNLEDLLPF